MRIVLATTVAFFCLTLPTQATEFTTPELEKYEAWAKDSRVPSPQATIDFYLEGCPGAPDPERTSCAIEAPPETWNHKLFLAPRHANNKSVFYHELGHIFDFVHLRERHKQKFNRIVKRPEDYPWDELYQPPDRAIQAPSQEWFASAYSLCARFKDLPNSYQPQYFYMPTNRQHIKSCRLIRRAYQADK